MHGKVVARGLYFLLLEVQFSAGFIITWSEWYFPKTSDCFRLKMTKDFIQMFPHLLQLCTLKDLQFSSGIIPGLEKCVFRKYSLNKHLYWFEDDGSQLLTWSELWDDQTALWWGCMTSNSPVEGREWVVPSSGQPTFRSVVIFWNIVCSFIFMWEEEKQSQSDLSLV